MESNLNCNQVITLLTFYIENKLDNSLSRAVKVHLENCPACMEKYNKLKQIFQNFSEIKSKLRWMSRSILIFTTIVSTKPLGKISRRILITN